MAIESSSPELCYGQQWVSQEGKQWCSVRVKLRVYTVTDLWGFEWVVQYRYDLGKYGKPHIRSSFNYRAKLCCVNWIWNWYSSFVILELRYIRYGKIQLSIDIKERQEEPYPVLMALYRFNGFISTLWNKAIKKEYTTLIQTWLSFWPNVRF